MIDYPTFCQIHHLAEQEHLTAAQIARLLHLDAQTVAKWMNQPIYQRRASPPRPSKLEAFKGIIVSLLTRHAYSAQQLFQQLQAQGYTGGYGILKAFVRQVRPAPKPAFLSLAFAPGDCAQVDWGSWGSIPVGSTRRRLSFFVLVLCFSRLMYVEFTLAETMEQFLSCLRHALEFIGAVPKRIMIDNLKVGVVEHPLGQPAHFHPRFLDFAAHHNFEPVACNVRKANEKGRVENGVGYVKKNFLNGLELPPFTALNPTVRQWLDTVANVRLHGETHRKPLELLTEEKPHLRPLPVVPYDCAVIKPTSANRCCRVRFDANRYSVPYLYASQQLTLKIYPDQLYFYYQEKLIATHPRSYDRGQDIHHPDHVKELVRQRHKAQDQTRLLAFLSFSPHAELYVRKLQEKRLNTPHHIQKIVALSELYSPATVAWALEQALAFEAYGCEYIANLLQQAPPSAHPPALHLTQRQELLDLELPAADLSAYEPRPQPSPPPHHES